MVLTEGLARAATLGVYSNIKLPDYARIYAYTSDTGRCPYSRGSENKRINLIINLTIHENEIEECYGWQQSFSLRVVCCSSGNIEKLYSLLA